MTADPSAVRVCVVVTAPAPAELLMALHRTLGIGLSEVLRRIDTGEPMVDVELFGNDHRQVTRLLESVLESVAAIRHSVHECIGDETPAEANRIAANRLANILAGDPESAPAVRPVPDAELSRAVAGATRAAITDLRAAHRDRFYTFALVASGELRAPYLSACSVEADNRDGIGPWDLAAGPYAVWGYDEHFGQVARAFESRGHLHELTNAAEFEREAGVRLASLEHALRLLDSEGFFGNGAARAGVLVTVATMPPDETDAGFVRRLNPASELYARWVQMCAEQPQPTRDPATSAELAAHEGPLSDPPNPAMAELWSATPGLYRPDGVAIYGPHSLAERNTTFEIAEYAPGWALVGDDGGGRGLFMRAPGPGFDPDTGRTSAEVFRCDLGGIGPDLAAESEFVTDDLIGWLTGSSQPGYR
ncbi:DUF4303 domain-containing protein [Rhodococcus triatomae]|uniref:DUF4303 domain-containing protein n=1 Tax=Rhodococcus triatomae TaxID=300028 RepID=A0A1G8EYZ3_9NOCA|nr:DUF4303 domain-containing protein [Rhodococcus triatomae]QNG19332.1 DUF4303 domain-containing protein [Rhodococcus triatomae]QNG24755.1 DUF4303 domain-containing protein [Rhodococcus triatomae]SDH75080.1 protein of unknown function [Rhodococcus triatomae]